MRQKRTAKTVMGALVLFSALCSTGEAHTQAAPPTSAPPAAPLSPSSASVALPPLDLAKGYIVPFVYDPPSMPFLVVQARVNGQGPYPFMVDTGVSTPLIIDKAFVPLLNLHNNGKHQTFNDTVKTTGVSVKTLQLLMSKPGETLTFNLVGGASTAYVADLSFIRAVYSGPSLAGVIGVPVLAPMTERIDFARHEITFYEQAHAPLQLPASACLPVHAKNSRYLVDIGAEDGVSTPLLVDTGALLTTLPLSFRSHLHPAATIIDGHATVGSYTLGSRWLLPALRVGTLSEPDIAATAADEGDAVLGLNVLTRFTLYLDFRNQQMLVQRAPDYDARRGLQGWTGIRLGQDNAVEGLRSTSPAYKAGVRTGDRILAIDGKPLGATSDYLIQKMLDGQAGTSVTLTLATGSAPPQTVIVERAREFDCSPAVLDGVMLHKGAKPYLEVRDVAPGSLADKAGLRTGERILKLNGLAAKTLDWADMWEQVQVSPIRMQVADAEGKHLHDILLTLPKAE